jgi:hypothetical protein
MERRRFAGLRAAINGVAVGLQQTLTRRQGVI